MRDRFYGVLIRSSEVDYRCDRSGKATEQPFEVPSELAERCVAVSAAFGFELSGIDFIRSDDDGEFCCLEVNPMPGHDGYDLTLNGEISQSLGEPLAPAA